MSDDSSESSPGIIVPGPELRSKVDNFAARLSAQDKRKADELIAKLLASAKRNQFLFVESSHIFYPYFLWKLTEYRNHPELRPEKSAGKAEAAGGGASAANESTTTTTTTRSGKMVMTSGRGGGEGDGGAGALAKQEEMLREAEAEARRYLEDPFPSQFTLDLKGGTVDMPALVMDIMSCTAQYAAKYGDAFVMSVMAKQRHNPVFRFLQTEDVRHGVFVRLVESYRRILHFDADETETRLESMLQRDHVLNTICAEKVKYTKAALARRKAALLTDDDLRERLNWNSFTVLRSFTLSDLCLDGPDMAYVAAAVAEAAAGSKSSSSTTQVHTPSPASPSVQQSGSSSVNNNMIKNTSTDTGAHDGNGEKRSEAPRYLVPPSMSSSPAAHVDSTGASASAQEDHSQLSPESNENRPVNQHTILPPAGMSVHAPTFMSANLVRSSAHNNEHRKSTKASRASAQDDPTAL